jgi:hypothetical protein
VLLCILNSIQERKLKWEFKVYVDSAAATLLTFDKSNVTLGGIYVSSCSNGIMYWDGKTHKWGRLPSRLPKDTWVRIVLTLDRDQMLYSGTMEVAGEKGEESLFKNAALDSNFTSETPIEAIIISPQVGGPMYFDDFKITGSP